MNAQKIVELAAAPAIATHSDDRIISWNESASDLFRLPDGLEVVGKRFHNLVKARDAYGNRINAGQLAFYEMVTVGEAPQSFVLLASRPSGETLRLAVAVVVVVLPRDGSYELVYLLRRLLRRRRSDLAIDRLLGDFPGEAKGSSPPCDGSPVGACPSLTKRQIQILKLIADGKASKEIATVLGVRVNTARRHIQDILSRLDAHSKAEAVAKGYRNHIL